MKPEKPDKGSVQLGAQIPEQQEHYCWNLKQNKNACVSQSNHDL